MSNSKLDDKPLFENKYTLTREMNKKYARITYSMLHSKWQISTFVISIILFLLAFVMVFLKLPILFVIFILIGLYVFFMSWFGYIFQAYISYKDMARFYGDPINMHIIFYPEFFRVVGDNETFDFFYSQIKDKIEYENMSIFIISGKGMIEHGQIINKSAFSPEDLTKFYKICLDKINIQSK
ncbi:MAG: hypothetical protein MJ126_01170 [Lachnospiraceae bacterium]|nr:hypothetical protein [Lachnospiraceae bacterium]